LEWIRGMGKGEWVKANGVRPVGEAKEWQAPVDKMRTMNRWELSRGPTTLQEQLNRVFGDGLERAGDESNLTPWAPPVDIFETEHELVVKADNVLTIRGERKFEIR
jgi:hypothetical protein